MFLALLQHRQIPPKGMNGMVVQSTLDELLKAPFYRCLS